MGYGKGEKIISFMCKKINYDWYLVGLLPLAFGILSYIIAIIDHSSFWQFFWVCPVTAIATGLIVLSRNRFAISAIIVWISNGPLLVILFETNKIFAVKQFHHIFSVLILFIILYHWKKTWNAEGFLFGSYSFYAYVTITSNLSGGAINLLGQIWGLNKLTLYLGIFFVVLSVAIFLWHNFERKFKQKIIKR